MAKNCPKAFSPAEEELLINLKETQHLGWKQIAVAFAETFPKRSAGALQVHYCRKLQSQKSKHQLCDGESDESSKTNELAHQPQTAPVETQVKTEEPPLRASLPRNAKARRKVEPVEEAERKPSSLQAQHNDRVSRVRSAGASSQKQRSLTKRSSSHTTPNPNDDALKAGVEKKRVKRAHFDSAASIKESVLASLSRRDTRLQKKYRLASDRMKAMQAYQQEDASPTSPRSPSTITVFCVEADSHNLQVYNGLDDLERSAVLGLIRGALGLGVHAELMLINKKA